MSIDKYSVLKQYFGYDYFRNGQEQLIDSILEKKDTLGIMPTGAGKSICFQIPAMVMDGITLVISPLISLMKDQVTALIQAGIPAAFLNSSLSVNQYRLALKYASEGRYKIIYIAPERLLTEEFLYFSSQANISMISIDEAHCVSQWGQDFRPSYLKIKKFIEILSRRPIISAFTATATKEVRDDIIEILELKESTVVATGFDRKNLSFEVRKPKNKYSEVLDYVQNHSKESGIIYCATRKNVEEVCANLSKEGYATTRYHAGLLDRERKQNQEDFVFDVKPIMVATNAFGMGIDKSNVSFVIHYNMPKNLESYYQEAGRAGRDGEPAECILKYFGDNTVNFCGNCSNCTSHFEEIDITDISRKIISCIGSAQGRYGIKVMIDTMRGSKGQKILRNRLDELPTYGNCNHISEKKLRDIINYLVIHEYLFLTNCEYPTVGITKKASVFIDNQEEISMKIVKEEKRTIEKKKKEKITISKNIKGSRISSGNEDIDEELFEELRSLRSQIAFKQKVPAYIVFNDAALRSMCELKPMTKAEFLNVSGVGEVKMKHYGEAFIEAIRKYEKV